MDQSQRVQECSGVPARPWASIMCPIHVCNTCTQHVHPTRRPAHASRVCIQHAHSVHGPNACIQHVCPRHASNMCIQHICPTMCIPHWVQCRVQRVHPVQSPWCAPAGGPAAKLCSHFHILICGQWGHCTCAVCKLHPQPFHAPISSLAASGRRFLISSRRVTERVNALVQLPDGWCC